MRVCVCVCGDDYVLFTREKRESGLDSIPRGGVKGIPVSFFWVEEGNKCGGMIFE